MKTLGIVANCEKKAAASTLRELSRLARRHGLDLVVTCAEEQERIPGAKRFAPGEWARRVDAVLALGGDGTVLRAARLLGARPRPILGINLGALGFLTSGIRKDLPRAVRALASGKFTVSERLALRCRIYRGKNFLGETRALNDVVLGWGESSRMITLDLQWNNSEVTSYKCDGLIVCTPTGSTAHSLSAGGPILHPEAPCLVITAICPHTLSHRPLVIPAPSRVRIRIRQAGKKLILSADGQETRNLREGDAIEVETCPDPVRFVNLSRRDFFARLRHKLAWRGSNT